ncbi:MAG: type II toxin-antitoxin system VapC family toxin [Burkholderiaceae bacterium]|nr:type II toxin-antitoxin system VapC family toxin [Burkholderiaceae bacterium]
MQLCDVNILVYAHRSDSTLHAACLRWLEDVVNSDAAYGFSELVLSGFLRIVTHPKVFAKPTPLGDALAFTAQLREQANAVPIAPGARHWGIFQALCTTNAVRGNLVADAYLAALAIESGCEWVTTDRDFARFAGLRIRSPLT